MNEQAKRLDHITRALRIEAPEAIAKKYAEQVEEDKLIHQVRQIISKIPHKIPLSIISNHYHLVRSAFSVLDK